MSKNSINNDNNVIKTKYQHNTKWELILVVQAMKKDGYTIKQISDTLGLANKTVIKYSKITADEEDKYNNKTTPEIKKQNSLKIKEELIKKQKSLEIKVYHLAKLVEKWI